MAIELNDLPFQFVTDIERLRPLTMGRVVDGWLRLVEDEGNCPDSAQSEFFWACEVVTDLREYPDLVFDFIAAVLATNPKPDVLSVLAAGPMEDLLADHGPKVITRVEDWARKDPAVRNLLGGVWQNRMPDEIWARVQKAAPNRW